MKNCIRLIDFRKVCRLCFVEKNELLSIFDNENMPNLSLLIKECVSIEVDNNSDLPNTICQECFHEIQNWMQFKEKCGIANSELNKYLQNLQKIEVEVAQDVKYKIVENTDSTFSSNELLVNLLFKENNAFEKRKYRVKKENSGSKQNKNSKTTQERRALYRAKYNQYQRKTYPCDICDKKFTRFCDLFNHDKIDHENLPRNCMCGACGKLFISENRVFIHKSRYHGDKPFTCDICKKNFLTKKTLQKHLIIHNKNFTCPYCNLSTSSKSSLVEHIRVHTREKPYTCDECGNSYISHNGLNSHKKTHSSEKLFMCSICGYSARNQSSIYIHKGSHSNVKQFICENCGKAFKSKIRLNEHIRRHTAEKRFTCDTCNVSFKQNYQLIKHYRVHSGEKPYSCDVCNKNFARSDSLKEHRRIHTGEKRYTCEVCLKAFSFLKPYKTHKCITSI